MVCFSQYWYIIINQSPSFILIFSVFPWYPFYIPRSHPGGHIMFGWRVSLKLLLAMTAYQICPCFWLSWHFWGILVRYFEEFLSVGICLMFFLWLDIEVMDFWEEDHRCKVSLSLYHIKGTCDQYDLSLLIITFITWLEIVFVWFLHCKFTLFFLVFPSCSL